MTPEQVAYAHALLTQPDATVASIARLLWVSRSTIYKYVPELKTGGRPTASRSADLQLLTAAAPYCRIPAAPLTMGNREDLIAGAKRCLIEKGYAHTTARDIAAASGVSSLAAIGYHFGSKDALMNQAVYESVGEWADEVQRALTDEGALDAEPLRRFESIMGQTIESFGGAGHGLWAAQLELMSLLEHNEKLRTFLAGIQRDAATGLAELFLGIDPAQDPEPARMAGSVLHAPEERLPPRSASTPAPRRPAGAG